MLWNKFLLYGLMTVAATSSAQAEERLTSQEVHAVGAWVGPQIGPAKSPEARAAEERHVFMLGKSGAMALRCQYEITERGEKLYAEVVLWHRDVGATQRELAAVSPVHSLALLGDRAFQSCPDRATAAAHAQRSLTRFRKIAAGTDPDTPGPAPTLAIDPSKPVICAYVDTSSGSFEFYNNCDFDVNFSYCRSLLSRSLSQCQGNGQSYFARSKARLRLKIPHTARPAQLCANTPTGPQHGW